MQAGGTVRVPNSGGGSRSVENVLRGHGRREHRRVVDTVSERRLEWGAARGGGRGLVCAPDQRLHSATELQEAEAAWSSNGPSLQQAEIRRDPNYVAMITKRRSGGHTLTKAGA